ncbi:unnamed protein product [Medioppia subpectinata]|uniref:Fatty acid synthase n=1 Tax=Medioppia subpectinata TaxID=1979941 RepID=A0A7R9KL30_9ACAR|nr:unnamed protein product [Medioppia subpectinata]CAG2105207.1 unnamed protein product [Medioppia subpectinata]
MVIYLGIYDMSQRMGRINNYQHFDKGFFGLMDQLVESTKPESFILLEVSYEAILDSGVNPQSLRGSNTGVYIGLTTYPHSDGYSPDVQPDVSGSIHNVIFKTVYNMKNLYASRISFANDFKGPSLVVDTACSSSLSALTLACNDILLGKADAAIVCGTHMLFEPLISQYLYEFGVCSPRGVSAVFDESADGFVRSEAVVAVFLQRRQDSHRMYAQIVSSRMNVDGRKTVGMLYPSADSQEQLMRETYTLSNIDPKRLTYFEAHATGTKVGDPQEVKAIYNAYCATRTTPLPLGAVKSNIGHSEGSSGLAAVNNFGIGGTNAHVLLEPNYKVETSNSFLIAENIPRIVNICGRTEEAVKYVMDFIQNNPKRVTNDFLALLAPVMRFVPCINSGGMPYRVN